jgi:hypothetical protein
MTNSGWHPDPTGEAGYRYWDGERWTDQVWSDDSPPPESSAVTPSSGSPHDPSDGGQLPLILGALGVLAVGLLGVLAWTQLAGDDDDDAPQRRDRADSVVSDSFNSSGGTSNADTVDFGFYSGDFASDGSFLEFPFQVERGNVYRITASTENESGCRNGIFIGLAAPRSYFEGDRRADQEELLGGSDQFTDHPNQFDFLSDLPSAQNDHDRIFSDGLDEPDYLIGEGQCSGEGQPLDVVAEQDTVFTYVVVQDDDLSASTYEVTIEDLGPLQ